MDIRSLNTTLSVAPQITPLGLKALRDAGFRSVICNHPAGEGADQPSYGEIHLAAYEQRPHCCYLPAGSGKAAAVQTAAFGGDATGWTDVDPATLRHMRHADGFGLGDADNTPNARSVAATRKQAPVSARGQIALAEVSDGGKLAPSLPTGLIDGTRPSRLARPEMVG